MPVRSCSKSVEKGCIKTNGNPSESYQVLQRVSGRLKRLGEAHKPKKTIVGHNSKNATISDTVQKAVNSAANQAKTVTKLNQRITKTSLRKEMSDLYVKAVVGRGSFGLVKLVYHKRDRQPGKSRGHRQAVMRSHCGQDPVSTCLYPRQKYYALKCIGKKQVVQQKQEKSMILEREINSQCYHPCIMHFITTFQDRA